MTAVVRPTLYTQNIDVRAYGALGDAIHDDTAAVQAALDACNPVNYHWLGAQGIFLPRGVFLVGTLNYKGQSIVGSGKFLSVLQGKSSQDVLHVDPSYAGLLLGTSWSHFGISVDDSVDASGSFPQRGGVGNAGFAADFANGAGTPPLQMNFLDMEDVEFTSSSRTIGGQNASCGIYTQYGVINQARLRDVSFLRLAYGLWDSYPTSNLASTELYRDHNHFDSLLFDGCGYGWRMVNNGFSQITNLTVHQCTTGLGLLGVQSTTRARCSNLTLSTAMIEDATTSISCPYNPTLGANFLSFDNVWIAGAAGETQVTLGSLYSTFSRLFISTKAGGYPSLEVTGTGNILSGVTLQGVPLSTTYYKDSGTGNRVIDLANALDYAQVTSPVTCSGGTEATATTIVGGNAIAYDGVTQILIDCFVPGYGGADYNELVLYDGASSIGMTSVLVGTVQQAGVLRRVLTPSAATHTYSLRGFKGGSGTMYALAGTGGAGTTLPAFIRITRV